MTLLELESDIAKLTVPELCRLIAAATEELQLRFMQLAE